jgi:Zinc finger C-x8-C-x5-C-x3-H type (and similar)
MGRTKAPGRGSGNNQSGGGKGNRGGGNGGGRGHGGRRGPGVNAGGNLPNTGVCFDWKNHGTCRFGSNCKFSHASAGGGGVRGRGRPSASTAVRSQGGSSPPPKKIAQQNDAAVSFIRHLSALSHAKIGTEVAAKGSLWQTAWKGHATLDPQTTRLLVVVLTRVPGSSSADPPPLGCCEPVFTRFLAEQVNDTTSDEAVLTAVKTVLEAIKRFLCFEWQASRDDVKDVLSNIILVAEAKLRKKRKDHLQVASKLLEYLEDLDKPWTVKTKSIMSVALADQEGDAITAMSDYSAWKTATVKWLGEPKFFAPACCPVMKVGTNGVYDSPEDYMNTVHKLWVAMTFFDGFAAIAPRCRSRSPSGTCSNALWPVAANKGNTANMTCRRLSSTSSFRVSEQVPRCPL